MVLEVWRKCILYIQELVWEHRCIFLIDFVQIVHKTLEIAGAVGKFWYVNKWVQYTVSEMSYSVLCYELKLSIN